MNENPRLLVAADDERLRERLIGQLLADGFALDAASAARETRLKAGARPDLLLLGELGENCEALRLLRELRAGETFAATIDPGLPVIALLAERAQLSLLRAFDAGADDALCAPFGHLELRARIRAVLARCNRMLPSGPRRVGALAIDPATREVRYAGRPLRLSRMEFELLGRLACDPERVFTKRELLREVWGYRCEAKTRTLDAHACRLRSKLARAGAREMVLNARGVGYRLQGPSGPAPMGVDGPERGRVRAA